ncbi:hypothetical protein JCM16358_15110 [Halanaerocella petrolearia]
MELSIQKMILATFVESLLLSYVGLGLIGIKISKQKHIKIGILYTISVAIVRNILKLYGLHTLILFIVLNL